MSGPASEDGSSLISRSLSQLGRKIAGVCAPKRSYIDSRPQTASTDERPPRLPNPEDTNGEPRTTPSLSSRSRNLTRGLSSYRLTDHIARSSSLSGVALDPHGFGEVSSADGTAWWNMTTGSPESAPEPSQSKRAPSPILGSPTRHPSGPASEAASKPASETVLEPPAKAASLMDLSPEAPQLEINQGPPQQVALEGPPSKRAQPARYRGGRSGPLYYPPPDPSKHASPTGTRTDCG